jgi:hypothetical protein
VRSRWLILTSIKDWKPAFEASERARDAFCESVIRDLGVAGGAILNPPWPTQWMRNFTSDSEVADGRRDAWSTLWCDERLLLGFFL